MCESFLNSYSILNTEVFCSDSIRDNERGIKEYVSKILTHNSLTAIPQIEKKNV